MMARSALLLLASLAAVVPAVAADDGDPTTEQHSSAATTARLPKHLQLSQDEVVLPEEATYCNAIVDQARELRYSAREEELRKLQSELEHGLELIETKKAEFEKWVQRRDAFSNNASETLIAIYEKMRPEAAAERLTIVDPMLASAILLKMPPGKSGTILNEMEAKKAAGITAIMAASARKKNG